MPSSRAMSAARIGPVALSSSRIRLRTGCAMARSTLGSCTAWGPWVMPAQYQVPHGLLRKNMCASYRADMTRFGRLARNHDFTVLWTGATISELGSRMSMFVFPLLAFQLTGSAFVAALAESAHLLGLAVALLPAGVLADRFDRRWLMRLASGSGYCSTCRS